MAPDTKTAPHQCAPKMANGDVQHRLSLRLSTAQLAAIKERAGDLPLATYIRKVALGGGA